MALLTLDEQECIERAAARPMLGQVERWAQVNSGSANLAGLATLAGLLADAFSALPGELALREPQAVTEIDPAGRPQPRALGSNLHLVVRPQARLQLLLTGHMDTVFGPDHAFQSLAWREPGVLGGPGVTDMKGGLAVMIAALEAIESHPAAPTIGYEVVVNSDEELGSPGSAALIAEAAGGKQAALTYEPAVLPDGTLAAARPGSGNFSLTVTGRPAHAGRNPGDGRNALLAAADLALRLAAGAAPGLTVNPARIDGGGPNNVVPGHAVLRVNLRPATSADQQRAQALLDSTTRQVAAAHDVTIAVHGSFGRPPKPMTAASERLFELVRQAGADLGQTIAWQPSGGVCDGNNIASCGVPVVDTMGVRGGAIHSAEEYLITASLGERAALSALTILRLAGADA